MHEYLHAPFFFIQNSLFMLGIFGMVNKKGCLQNKKRGDNNE